MKIVFQGKTEKGLEVIIRYPGLDDTEKLLQYVNKLSKEKTFITLQGEEILLDDETKYLKNQLKAINDKKSVHLVVFCNDELVSASDISMMDKTRKHVGNFRIAILKGFRGKGLGKLLMRLVLGEAKKELAELKIVTLEVYATNDTAQNLYRSLGFVEYGRLPNGIIRNNNFDDEILMYKNIR